VALAVLALCATQPHWVAGHPARRGLSSTAVPAVYDRLAQLPEGALIELPMQSQPVHLGIAHFQYYQVRHARPILNVNPLTHIDDVLALRDLAREHDLLALFLDLSDAQAVLRAQVTSAQVRALRDLGFRLVAVHDRFPADAGHITAPAERIGMLPGPAFALMEDLFGPALLEGDGVRFYDLERGVTRAAAAPLPPHAWQEGTIGALDAFRTAHTPTLLPLSREPEAALLLGTAPPGRMLREVSLWVRAERGTALAVRFRDGGGAQIGAPAPVDIAERAWRWVRVVAPAGAVDAALVDTGADPLILSLTRAWLDTAPDPSLTAAPTEPGSTP
jgi:hypothetical protein